MAGVDNRIVTMKFDNKDFEANAKTSMSTLQKLKDSMNFGTLASGATNALGGIGAALLKLGKYTPFAPLISAAQKGFGMISGLFSRLGAKNPFSTAEKGAADLQKASAQAAGPRGIGALEGGVTGVSKSFVALTTIAVTALSQITTAAMNAGRNFVSALTTDQVKAGFSEYEIQLKSIQTILANTKQAGTDLKDVNGALAELNEYSDKTIYNFTNMTDAIAKFTRAGVDLDTSVSAIKGMANAAALSGSSAEELARAYYQVSQEISAGRVSLMGWNSIENAGIASATFKKMLTETAVAMGKLPESAVELEGKMQNVRIEGESFRDSIMAKPGEVSWLDNDVLLGTLNQFTGDMSKAQIMAQGFNENQAESIMATARTALAAAQDVKTLSGVFDVAKETAASGWSRTWMLIFGDFKEAKALFTEFSNYVSGGLAVMADKRNTMLEGWSELGGRDKLIEGFKNLGEAITRIFEPIRKGFRDIFPAQTSESLFEMTEGFVELTEKMIPSKDTMADIRDIAGGVFAVFGIMRTVIGGVIDGFKVLFESLGAGNGNFLDFLASIGRAVESFNDFLKESGVVTAFFEGLGGILSVPLALLQGFAGIFASIFSGFDSGAAAKVEGAIDGVGNRLSGLEVVGERIRSFFETLGDFFGGIGEKIGEALVGIGDAIAGAFTADTFGKTLDVVNTTLLGALVLMIRRFFSGDLKLDLTGGLFDGIKESLGAATSAFENMQAKLKADILIRLAIAIGVMAAALFVLSTIDPAGLRNALIAMTFGFGILIGAMSALMKFLGPVGLVQMYVVTTAMTKMAAAILLMAFALKTLAGIEFGDMLRGLVGLGAVMLILSKTLVPLAAGSKGMAKASMSLILVGIALNILAVALKIFATMSWEEMIKGLVGLGGSLAVLIVALKLMPKSFASEAAGLIALGISINLLAIAMKIFATMRWEEMIKGLVGLAGALLIIGAAIKLMPKSMFFQAIALVAVAGAMNILAVALIAMGNMGWENIAKGLVMLGGSLLILGIGLQIIGFWGTIGAIGLMAASTALAVLLPVMLAFAALSWESLLKSLTMLAGIFVVLGVSALVLAPLTPVIFALAAAMVLLGAGIALAGAGALAAATAFGIVVAAGAAGAQIMIDILKSIIKMIPPAMAAFGKGVVQFAVAIGRGAPRIAAAFGRILSNILDQVIRNAPKLGQAFMTLLNTGLNVIVRMIPRIADAGMRLIIGFLEAVKRHIPKITKLAIDIIVRFINTISRNLDRIIQAGVNLVIKFIEGVAKAIRNNSERMGAAGADLAMALVEGMVNGIRGGAGRIKDAALDAAGDAWEAAKNFFGIGSPLMRDTVGIPFSRGIALGIEKGAPTATKEVEILGRTLRDKMGEAMRGVDEAFALDPNLNPTISPVLDLTALTQEANKMGSILSAAPIMPTVSYNTAADISSLTSRSSEESGPGVPGEGSGGDTYVTYEQHLHSPKPIDSVEAYRASRSLLQMKRHELGAQKKEDILS